MTKPGATETEALLSDPQVRAIDLLLLGRGVQEIADEVGVDRSTLWRWRQIPAFQAELNRRREALWSGYTDRIRSLLKMSLEVLEMALDQGDVTTARELVKGVGLLQAAGAPGGYTDPRDIITEQRAEERLRENAALFAGL